MKIEEFDDEIRRKIEEINIIPTEQDIDRVQAYVRYHQSPTLFEKWGNKLLFSAATVLLLGSLFFYSKQHEEGKSLQQRLITLNHERDSLAKLSLAPKIERKVDTVYITRYVEYPSYQKTVNLLKESSGAMASKPKTPTAPLQTIVSTNKIKPDNDSTKFLSSSTAGAKQAVTFSKSIPDKIALPKSNKNLSNLETDKADNQIAFGKVTTTDLALSTPPLINNKVDFPNKEIVGKGIRLAVINNNRYAFIHFAPRSNLLAVKKGLSLHSSWLKNLRYRFGLEGEFADDFWGGGVVGEVFFGKNIGLSIGADLQGLRGERYFTDGYFQDQKGINFREKYATKIPNDDEILNINIGGKIVTLPIRLSYYRPLPRNFWLLASGGTNIDVLGSNEISFDYRNKSNEFYRNNNHNDLAVIPFSNIIFSVGLEKRLSHFDFQISPSFTTYFKEISYRRENHYLGGQFRIFYHF